MIMSDKKRGKEGKKGGNKKAKKDKTETPTSSVTGPPAAPKLKPMKSVEMENGKKNSLKCEARAGNPRAQFQVVQRREGVQWQKQTQRCQNKKKEGRDDVGVAIQERQGVAFRRVRVRGHQRPRKRADHCKPDGHQDHDCCVVFPTRDIGSRPVRTSAELLMDSCPARAVE
ncbi:hypothetical protein SKAU_G00277670 [Synaphobranchus kaupii]|uniref:Uncharacterized protein n=1 Tax=Synaphobranchus kaupii TaxID=118154 RepID=A0A9Q1EWH6_SYNKA|nr:hypothetical protein SKAU_G00277670 [Synaphobranchus kaupii]